MNEDNFFQNLFCKIIYGSGSFHKWKIFFDLNRRSDIFGFVKKKYDFCTKNHNSKYLQNTKKIFTSWKNSKSQFSNDIRFSTQTQGMTKIQGGKKVTSLFLFWPYLCHSLSLSGKSYIVGKLRYWTFSWCENFFGILKIFWVMIFGTKIILFFDKSKNITSPTQIKKIFHLWKLPLP